ncbi:MAG: LTA synthase family protein [Clostridia bacterium]|nr:LTA synthase family protein [Clostridia bacterium]
MKKRKNKIILINIFFVLGVVASLWVKASYLHHSIGLNPMLEYDRIHTLLIFSVVIIVLFNMLIFQRKAVYSLVITDLIVSFIFFADTVYGRYYGIPLTIPILYQLGFMNDVADSTFSLMHIKDLIFVVTIPVMIAYAVYFRKTLQEHKTWKHNLLIAILIVAAIGAFHWKASEVDRTHHAYERKNIAKDLGVYYFHGYDLLDFAKNKWFTSTSMDQAELETIKAYLSGKSEGREPLALYDASMNLVVIQVEAMQEFVVDLEIEGEEVTPFLNKLKEDALYFENIYHQVAAGNTSDAELLLNVGLHPAPVGAVNYLHATNRFITLGELLKDRGYENIGFHGYQASFWNREVVYNNFKFDDFISKEDFDLDEIVGWAISDVSFYRQAMDISIQNQPFYSFLVTLSSHHPYDAFNGYEPDTGDYEKTQVGNYLKSMRYVDDSIEGLFERLESEGILDETIIVIYGDHSGLYQDQKAPLSRLLGLSDHYVAWESIQKVPLWIVLPDSDMKGTISKTGGQVDILATILDIMGLDHPLTLGESLLIDGPGYVIKRDGSIIMDNYFYNNNEERLYDLKNHEPVEITETLAEQLERIKRDLKVSDLILKKNLFKNEEFMKLVE